MYIHTDAILWFIFFQYSNSHRIRLYIGCFVPFQKRKKRKTYFFDTRYKRADTYCQRWHICGEKQKLAIRHKQKKKKNKHLQATNLISHAHEMFWHKRKL